MAELEAVEKEEKRRPAVGQWEEWKKAQLVRIASAQQIEKWEELR